MDSRKKSISSLRLQNFRSYNDFAVELSSGVNIIIGPNASGKTNLLESVLLVSGVKSYRASAGDVISFGAEWARIDCQIDGGSRILKITNAGDKLSKVYELNTKSKKRLNFEDKLPLVLFEPEHMRLLTGSPELRRTFLDELLTETSPSYSKELNGYKRALMQRNKLLKSNYQDSDQLFVWNIRLSELAGQIVSARLTAINDINEQITDIYSQISDKKTAIKLSYLSKINLKNYQSDMLRQLEKNTELDFLRGFTGVGPHREDVAVDIRNQPASVAASRGETRTLVLSLKVIEKQFLEAARGAKPIILLDDVFSELDGSRRKSLTKYLDDYQTIITTTDADVISKNFAQHTNLIGL
ncbi:DNA replication and repair protein RecF [Candidatus Saccharibacteria bacterium]|nr:DNA replication and repair protein RecF [Candidatus Saccharibacteria bacterium]